MLCNSKGIKYKITYQKVQVLNFDLNSVDPNLIDCQQAVDQVLNHTNHHN